MVHATLREGICIEVKPTGHRVIQYRSADQKVVTYPKNMWGDFKPYAVQKALDQGASLKAPVQLPDEMSPADAFQHRMTMSQLKFTRIKGKKEETGRRTQLLVESERGGDEDSTIDQVYSMNASPSQHIKNKYADENLPLPGWMHSTEQSHLVPVVKAQARMVKARHAIKNAKKWETGVVDAMLKAAESCMSQRKYDETKKRTEEALQQFEAERCGDTMMEAKLWALKGKACYMRGTRQATVSVDATSSHRKSELQEAQMSYRKALELNEHLAEAWTGLGNTIATIHKGNVVVLRDEWDQHEKRGLKVQAKLDAIQKSFKENPDSYTDKVKEIEQILLADLEVAKLDMEGCEQLISKEKKKLREADDCQKQAIQCKGRRVTM